MSEAVIAAGLRRGVTGRGSVEGDGGTGFLAGTCRGLWRDCENRRRSGVMVSQGGRFGGGAPCPTPAPPRALHGPPLPRTVPRWGPKWPGHAAHTRTPKADRRSGEAPPARRFRHGACAPRRGRRRGLGHVRVPLMVERERGRVSQSPVPNGIDPAITHPALTIAASQDGGPPPGNAICGHRHAKLTARPAWPCIAAIASPMVARLAQDSPPQLGRRLCRDLGGGPLVSSEAPGGVLPALLNRCRSATAGFRSAPRRPTPVRPASAWRRGRQRRCPSRKW
jgi:hypothetical protein